MSLEIENRMMLSPREDLQTPPDVPEDFRLEDPDLSPPAQIVMDRAAALIHELPNNPRLLLELPSMLSGPTAAKTVAVLLNEAHMAGVPGQVAVHTWMDPVAFDLARQGGAQRVHLYGCSSPESGAQFKPVDHWLRNLRAIAPLANLHGIQMRASLEQTPSMDDADLAAFLHGVVAINRDYGPVVTGIGLPDTNGKARVKDYVRIFSVAEPILKGQEIDVFVHLHDDDGEALDVVEGIVRLAYDNLPLVIEAVDPMYPGERTGLQPTYENVDRLGLGIVVPEQVNGLIVGSTWRRNPTKAKRDLVKKIHTAGVHTSNMDKYSNGQGESYTAPGMYGIMGQENIAVHQMRFGRGISSKETLKAAAAIGRELALQEGNSPQADVIALAWLALHEDGFMRAEAAKFGHPSKWLTTPTPDLRGVRGKLNNIVKEMWGNYSQLKYVTV